MCVKEEEGAAGRRKKGPGSILDKLLVKCNHGEAVTRGRGGRGGEGDAASG